jgi:hypothetical protein
MTAAGAWLGGLILVAIVAQSTFVTMRTTGVARPDSISGQVMAPTFIRFERMQMILAAIILMWAISRIASAGRNRRDWARLLMIVAAIGLLSYASQVLTPKIVELQPLLRSDAPAAEIKQRFDEFHRASVQTSKVLMVLVLALCFEMAWPRRDNRLTHNGAVQ